MPERKNRPKTISSKLLEKYERPLTQKKVQKKSMKKYRMDPWMNNIDPEEEAIIEETVIHDPLQSH